MPPKKKEMVKVGKVKKAEPKDRSSDQHKRHFDQLLDDAIFGVKKKKK